MIHEPELAMVLPGMRGRLAGNVVGGNRKDCYRIIDF